MFSVKSSWRTFHKRSVLMPSIMAIFAVAGLVFLLQSQAATVSATSKPNIIFILTDDQMVDGVAHMPYLNSLTNWINFPNALVNNSLCCPSRASIMTGRADTNTGVINNSNAPAFDPTQSIATWLKSGGYYTSFFGKYLNHYPFDKGTSYEPPGWDQWYGLADGGATNYYKQYNYNMIENGVQKHYGTGPGNYQVDVLKNKAVSVIKSMPIDQPLLMYFAPVSTHQPFVAAPRDQTALSDQVIPHYPNYNETDVSDKPDWVKNLPLKSSTQLAAYDANHLKQWQAALSIDTAMKAIDSALKSKGRATNTVYIFMSDNGYSFGAHRWDVKRCPYNECHQVPFMVRYPGQAARTDTHLVTNLDIASTLADIAQVTPTLKQDGTSIVPLLKNLDPSDWRTGILEHWGGGDDEGVMDPAQHWAPAYFGIRTLTSHYVEYGTGEKELYDLTVDPYELNNHANDPNYAIMQFQAQSQLDTLKLNANETNTVLSKARPTAKSTVAVPSVANDWQ